MLWEQDILEGNHLGDKSSAYFQLTVTDRGYFTGKENLAIRVIMESFGSDPDLYISKVLITHFNHFHRPTLSPPPPLTVIGTVPKKVQILASFKRLTST
jgi:hypothetical protein